MKARKLYKTIIMCLFVITGAIIISCCDKNKPTASEPDWEWSPLDSGVHGPVYALIAYDNKLIAGGSFGSAGGMSANDIAAWDGTSWSALGTGFNGMKVAALAVYNNKLIAGGSFFTAGDLNVSNIAAWDGSSWSPLGAGIQSRSASAVTALAIYDNKLIVAGSFDSAGGIAANHIAAWDGSSWEPLGEGISGEAGDLIVFDEKLLAGGDFDISGTVMHANVAAWDGSSWTRWNDIVAEGHFRAFINYDNILYALGYFLPGIYSNMLAYLDGSSWTVVGPKTHGAVESVTEYNGKLIIGGGAVEAYGDVMGCSIAEWDGFNYATLSGSPNSFVLALAVYDGKLYAGGIFESAGGKPVNHIAVWEQQ